ncbi:hypothetical protein R1sor_023962 [Riccia sorocarpa]|uniref:Uncharacterized protein n=1 Tax=Riccia sorocarpa TaxID=122646 RepID=A0ABD3GQP1_9MARC
MASQQSLLGDSQPGGSTNQQTRMETQQANGLQTILPEQPRMITIPGVGTFATFEGIWYQWNAASNSYFLFPNANQAEVDGRIAAYCTTGQWNHTPGHQLALAEGQAGPMQQEGQVQIQNPLRSGASTPPEDPSSGSPQANEAFRATTSHNSTPLSAEPASDFSTRKGRPSCQPTASIPCSSKGPGILNTPNGKHVSLAITECKGNGSRFRQRRDLRDVDPTWGANITDEELIQAFQELQQHCPPCTGKVIKSIEINPYRGKVRVDQMRRAAVILHTMDLMPTVAKVEEWAVGRLHHELGVKVVQVRLLSRKHFLIILGFEEDKVKVLTAPTLYMWRRMFTWGGSVQNRGQGALPNSHLHIRACVQINLAEPLVDTVEIKRNGTVLFRQAVHYQKLPNVCFLCHDTCHWIKDCPLKVAENQKKADQQTEDQAQGRGGQPRRRNEKAEDFRQNETDQDEREEYTDAASEDELDELAEDNPEETTEGEEETMDASGSGSAGEADLDLNMNTPVQLDTVPEDAQGEGDQEQGILDTDIAEGEECNQLNININNVVFSPELRPAIKRRGFEEDANGDMRMSLHTGEMRERRIQSVKNWLKDVGKQVTVMAFQEMMAGEADLEFTLRRLMERSQCIIDYTMNERGGAALLIHQKHKVIRAGVKGNGTLAWGLIEVENSTIGVASVYNPSGDERGRKEVYDWLKELGDGNSWVFVGDRNMVLSA